MSVGRRKVSIVIPCFNGEAWIREALESVIRQGVPDTELIVVDDGSTDRSPELIGKEFPAVHLVRQEHSGPSRARNRGTQLSTGDFIQYLDADDLLAPGKLHVQLRELERTEADVAYGDWRRLVPRREGGYQKRETIRRKIQGRPEIALFTDFWCPPAVYLFRRRIVEKVEGWNERLAIIQDARFVLDCALRGGKFVYCSGIMAYYRVHSSGSVSRRDPVAFVRECFQNALEVEEEWLRRGGINGEHRKALLKVYGYVARATFKTDPPTFEAALNNLERLKPGYLPEGPVLLALASRLVGYRHAERLALWYRRAKGLIKASLSARRT